MPQKWRPRRGQRKRLAAHDYSALQNRVAYICDFLFGGDRVAMSHALNIQARELYRVLSGHQRATTRLLAHVAVTLNVSAEWLLCGVGPVRKAKHTPDFLSDAPPPVFNSAFKLFDSVTNSAGAEFSIDCFPAPVLQNSSDPQAYLLAGHAVYTARTHNNLVGFFLGSGASSPEIAAHVLPFYQQRLADLLVLTLTAAHQNSSQQENLTLDLNDIARRAATHKIGYGEALYLAAPESPSLLAAVQRLTLPALIAAGLGELPAHTAPAFCGAETGAAIGAAAYVDLLVLTEQLKRFFASPGGVFFIAGEHLRGLQLLLARLPTLSVCVPDAANFTFAIFSDPDPTIETIVQTRGGNVIFLGNPTAASFQRLLQTCTDVYAGKISHDHRKQHE